MKYSRYLDIHFMDNFSDATFKRDVADQKVYQSKKSEYQLCSVMPLSIRRKIKLDVLSRALEWVCNGGELGGKIRINAHGDKTFLSNNVGEKISMEQLAEFLSLNGLKKDNLGDPGLLTVNFAVCYGAHGDQETWMIKKLADTLKLPNVKFTGSDEITRMVAGKLHTRHVPAQSNSKRYIPPHRREIREEFSGSTHKHEYTYKE